MRRYLAGIAGIVSLGFVGFGHAQSYAQVTNDLRVGVVIIDSSNFLGQPVNYTPYVWYNVDADAAVKPAGWNLYNPAGTTQVTAAVQNRWPGLPMGASLGKPNAAYWEVPIGEASDTQLAQYDALELSAYGVTSLTSLERDKLRKFVDSGGVLWIDISSGSDFSNYAVNTFPLPVQSSLGGGPLTGGDPFSPLTTTPYSLGLASLELARSDTGAYLTPLPALDPMDWSIESWIITDFSMHFDTVASEGGGPSILLGHLGDGYVVVTSSAVANTLNRVPTGGGGYNANTQSEAVTPAFDQSAQAAAKFAINLLSLSSTCSQVGNGARKPHSIPIDLRPPLIARSRISVSTVATTQSPVLYKGLLVVSAGNTLKVYSAHPGSDLDLNGNPDDGIQDYSLGKPYDELWEFALPNQISSATCAEVPSAAVKDQIFVVDSQGNLYAFDAFNVQAGTIQAVCPGPLYGPITPPSGIQSPSYDPGEPDPGPYPPTFHDGLLYISAVQTSPITTGAVWVWDPQSKSYVNSGGQPWYLGGGMTQTLPEPSASPTIGYIPVQDNSGAYDLVMYLAGRPSSIIGPTGTASITSLWMGVRGESPAPGKVTFNPGDMEVQTRAGSQGLNVYDDGTATLGDLAKKSLGIKLTMLHANTGIPFTNIEMKQYFTGQVNEPSAGFLDFQESGGQDVSTIAGGVSIRIDYSIDWAPADYTQTNAITTTIIRGQLYLPDDYIDVTSADSRRHIVGGIAMSPRGTIYCVTSTEYIAKLANPNGDPNEQTMDCGSYYAIREDIGRGGFRLLTRYQLYPRHNIPLNQTKSGITEVDEVNYEQTFEDEDGLLSLANTPYLQGKDFSHLTFMGAPSVHNGIVYCTAGAYKAGIPTPFGILMAFKAEPDPAEINVGNIADGFSLRQVDIDRSGNHVSPTATNDMTQGNFTYNRGEGIVRFDNLMSTNRGVMVNAFSTSQPVVIRRTNAPDQLIEPAATSAKWSPLLWYSVMHGLQVTAGPFTSGNSVFVPGISYVPNYVTLGILQPVGVVMAWNGNISPNDKFLQPFPDGTKPWLLQLWQFGPYLDPQQGFKPIGPSGPNKDVLWPQITGIASIQDYGIRVRQTELGDANLADQSLKCYGVAGGDGTLAAWGDQGVYTFQKSDFFVADQGRLGQFDPSGNPIWIAGETSSTGTADQGSVGTIKPLISPSRAYPVGNNDVVVADPGGNRIAVLDQSGNELRSITGFKIDPTQPVPDGFSADEPTTLNSPRDVAVYDTYPVIGGVQELWTHYVIADAGNKRLVEIVDEFTADANRNITGTINLGVLLWHSPSNFSGKDFAYNSVSRVYDPSSGRYFYVAGIGGTMPTRINTGLDTNGALNALGNPPQTEAAAGSGGVVVFDPLTPDDNTIINQIPVPDIPANTYWNFQTGTWDPTDRPGHYKSLTNLTSVTAKIVFDVPNNQPRIAVMLTDSSGVYEVWQQPNSTDWQVRWMLPNEAYRAIRRVGNNAPAGSSAVDLHATYARRLDDGDVIVANGYLGQTLAGADFNGEVIEVYGDFNANLQLEGFDWGKPNLGFDLGMITFQLPPIQGARGLVVPIFADRH